MAAVLEINDYCVNLLVIWKLLIKMPKICVYCQYITHEAAGIIDNNFVPIYIQLQYMLSHA